MPLRLLDASFTYPDGPTVLTAVDLHLTEGWTGVVGPNGGGKTTLLGLLAGTLLPTTGTVERPSSVVCCPQRVDTADDRVHDLAERWDKLASRLRGRLGLDPDDLDRWATLSPGERKRWQVGAALAEQPEVLLLDEPTNHLDAAARDELVSTLRRYRGIGAVVSHDRALLEALTTATVLVDRGTATRTPVSYGAARAQWDADLASLRAERDAASQEARTLQRRLADARRSHAAAERSRSLRRVDPRDHDARSTAAKARAQKGADRRARAVTVTRAAAERAAHRASEHDIPEELGRSVFVGWTPPRRSVLLSLDGVELRAGPRVILQQAHARVLRDTRVRLAGPNGCGKTTVLTALLAHPHLEPERNLHLPQELTADEGARLADQARALPRDTRGRAMQLVAALGVPPSRLLRAQRPSPGEARKLAVALGLARQVQLVVLDEPTNHLDLPSIERLQHALTAYPGALVLVTHDDALAQAVTTSTWSIPHDLAPAGGPMPREG